MSIPKEANILGTKYKVEMTKPIEGEAGHNDRSTKKIVIGDLYQQEIDNPLDNLDYDMEATFRHELFHALFHEAGMDNYANDEKLVDALSILAPKIKEYL